MVGFDHAVAGVDVRSFDNRQQIPLNALARNIGPVLRVSADNLVDFVQENNARLLHAVQRGFGDLVHVNELLRLFGGDDLQGFRHFDVSSFLLLRHHVAQHVFQVEPHVFHAGGGKDLDHGAAARLGNLQLHHAFVQLSVVQQFAQLFARRVLFANLLFIQGQSRLFRINIRQHVAHVFFRGTGRQQQIQKPVFGNFSGLCLNMILLLGFQHVDGKLHQIAHHGFHVPSHIADFRKF